MTVSLKEAAKFVGIIVMSFCAVMVVNMFLNYDIDLRSVADGVDESGKVLYEALLMNNKVVCLVTGGCLVLTSAVMLIFYIWQYIEAHSAQFGILKALGYSDLSVAVKCAVFGFCVLIGTAGGYALSWAVMPAFYRAQNSDISGIPYVNLNFHASLPFLLIALPSVLFCALSVLIAFVKLKRPALLLIKGGVEKERKLKQQKGSDGRSFLRRFAVNILKEKKLLAFFIAFGAFCFGAMTQMGISMRDYASDMMGIMILVIGLVLAAVSLLMAMSTAVRSNAKKIAMLKVNGYSLKECGIAVLGLYHIPAVIGFAVGTVYQWGLLNVMINVVFASFDDVPSFSFDWAVFAICLALFAVTYELLNLFYLFKIAKSPLKSVMSE